MPQSAAKVLDHSQLFHTPEYKKSLAQKAKLARSTYEEIVKNAATGEPTGIITGFASTTLVTRVLPEWTHEQWKQGLLGAVAVFNAQGITSVMEGALPADMIRLYTELHNEGRLNLRVTVLQEYSPRMVNDLHKLRVRQLAPMGGAGSQELCDRDPAARI